MAVTNPDPITPHGHAMDSNSRGPAPDPLQRARYLVETGGLAEAGRLVRAALTESPDSARAMTLAGQIAVRGHDAAAAVRRFARATVSAGRDDPRALLNLARAHQLAGNPASAAAVACRAMAMFPEDIRPRAFLALLDAAAGRFADAASRLGPGGAQRLDPTTALRLGLALARADAHRGTAADLLARAASVPGPDMLAAQQAFLAVAPDDHPARFDTARRLLVQAPDSVDGMDAVATALGRRRNMVRRAGWQWQSCCIRPADADRLNRAALSTWEVKWPRHGVAANRRLSALYPADARLLQRICDLYALQKAEGLPEAVAWAQQTASAHPRNPAVCDMVAVMLKDIGAHEPAAEIWQRGLRDSPGHRQLHYNYGLLRFEQSAYDEALPHFRAALILQPSYVRCSNMLGMTWNVQHRFAEAERYMRWAITCEPTNANALVNYGTVLRAFGRSSDALAIFTRAERCAVNEKPMVAAARFNAGMTKLQLGELQDGFALIEARWETRGFPSPRRRFPQPIWRGPHIHRDRRLLAYMEQGMGDEVMMSWFVPFLRRDTERLVVDCDARLVDLFARTYEGVQFLPRPLRDHDRPETADLTHKIPLFHVPQYYVEEMKFLIRDNWDWADRRGTRFPARLATDPARLDRWRRWLGDRYPGRPWLALSWRSRNRSRFRDQQYLSVEELARAIPPGAVAVNLQYSYTEEEATRLAELGQRYGYDFVTPEGVDLTQDLEDVFALLQVSDAAVTPMISLAWMAGAVGCPAYVFRSASERVIWQQFGTPFVPWAPSLRLFFRSPEESWDPVIAELHGHLAAFLATSGRPVARRA